MVDITSDKKGATKQGSYWKEGEAQYIQNNGEGKEES